MFYKVCVSCINLLVFSKALLKEHANDIPKLSYTGKPIVKWPKRVSQEGTCLSYAHVQTLT